MSPGAMYERTKGDEYWPTSHCTVHDAYEMYHTCGGGIGEPMGYCAAWPGDYVEREIDYYGRPRMVKDPTCVFREEIGGAA